MWKLVICACVLSHAVSAACVRADSLVLVAGGGTGEEGPAFKVELKLPFGVDFDPAGNTYIVEFGGHRLLRVDKQGQLMIVAGTGAKGNRGDDGPALKATFNSPHSIAVGPDGSVYIADTWNNRIRQYEPKSKKILPFAGSGKKGFAGDGGPAAEADFGGVYGIALDSSGSKMYVTDLDNRRIRAVDMTTLIVNTVAGNGKAGVPKNETVAVDGPLVDPRAVACDRKDNLYILERSGNVLRVVDRKGKIRTVVGTGARGLAGDGGDALKATMNGPKALCIDLDDNVIIADTANHVIRKYLPREGKIVRVAGTGKKGPSGKGGDPLTTPLDEPHGVAVDASGTLYIVDSFNNRVFKYASP